MAREWTYGGEERRVDAAKSDPWNPAADVQWRTDSAPPLPMSLLLLRQNLRPDSPPLLTPRLPLCRGEGVQAAAHASPPSVVDPGRGTPPSAMGSGRGSPPSAVDLGSATPPSTMDLARASLPSAVVSRLASLASTLSTEIAPNTTGAATEQRNKGEGEKVMRREAK